RTGDEHQPAEHLQMPRDHKPATSSQQPATSFDDRKFPDMLADLGTHVEDVQPRSDLQVVLGSQIPFDHARRGAVVSQGLDELTANRVDPDGGTRGVGSELEPTFASAGYGKSLGLEFGRCDIWIGHDVG